MRRVDATDLYLGTVLTLLRVTETANSIALCERFAAVIGGTAARTSRRKYQNTLRALSNYFGVRHDTRTLQHIARRTFHTFWSDAFALCQLDWRAVLDATPIMGLEHLEHAHAQGRGVIVLENSYFGLRNLAKRILHAHGWQIHQTHATNHLAGFNAHGNTKLRQRVLRPAFEEREKNFVASIVHLPSDGSFHFTRAIARMLADNAAVYFSGDGDTSHKFVRADFLGQPAPFPTGIINLARLTGAPVVPLFCFRDQKNRVVVSVHAPLEFPDNARAAEIGMAHYAARYTQYIDAYPEQYRNWHSLNM